MRFFFLGGGGPTHILQYWKKKISLMLNCDMYILYSLQLNDNHKELGFLNGSAQLCYCVPGPSLVSTYVN